MADRLVAFVVRGRCVDRRAQRAALEAGVSQYSQRLRSPSAHRSHPPRVRPSLALLAVALTSWIAFAIAVLGMPHVSMSTPSPDGSVVAEVNELTWVRRRHR